MIQEVQDYTNGTPTASTNQTTNYTYDGMGNVLTVQAVMPAGTPSQTTQYVYGVTVAGGSAINSNDLLATVEQPDPTTGNPSTSPSNQTSYTYNALGDVLTATDPNGTVHTFSYDVLGRQTADAVTTLGSGVDGSVLLRTTAYNALGLPYLFTSYNAVSGGSIVNQVQDVDNGLGQLTGQYQEQTGAVNTSTSPEVQYAYTEMSGGQNNSRLTQMIYPNGRTLDYVYNAGLDSSISRLSAIADDNGGSPGTTLEGYSYLGLATIVQYSHPQTGINLTYIQQPGQPNVNSDGGDPYVGLDRFGRIIDQNWWNPTTQTATDRFQYAYDRNGNLLDSNNLVNSAESELYRANSTASGDSNTAYDGLGRQTAFARGTLSSSGNNGTQLDTISSPSRTQTYNLDAVGNFAGTTTNGSTTTQTFNAQNQSTSVSGGTAPTFDHNGNTISDAGLTYVYNAWNQLVTVKNGSTTEASYAYDALGRRITETTGSTVDHLYYSPQGQVIEERVGGTASSNVQYQYVWGAGYVNELVLRDTYSGGVEQALQRLYAQWNANYNVTALVNTSGQVVERYLYDPYGAVTVLNASWTPVTGNTSAYGWLYLFQGGRLDTVTGWYEFGARDLIPAEGRWAERDPLGLGGGSRCLYSYESQSPANLLDPSGLFGDRTEPYRKLFIDATPDMPKEYQVHHTKQYALIERYAELGTNVNAVEYLVGVPREVHYEISAIQMGWAEDQMREMKLLKPGETLGSIKDKGDRLAKFYSKVDLAKFEALEAAIEKNYGKYFLKPGDGKKCVDQIQEALGDINHWKLGKGARFSKFANFVSKYAAISGIFMFIGDGIAMAKGIANPSAEQQAAFDEFQRAYERRLEAQLNGSVMSHNDALGMREEFLEYLRAIKMDETVITTLEATMGVYIDENF